MFRVGVHQHLGLGVNLLDGVGGVVDADGNWLRQTDGKIKDKAIEREVEALDNTETFQNHTSTVDDHLTESVGGIKKIEALGGLLYAFGMSLNSAFLLGAGLASMVGTKNRGCAVRP